MAEPQQPNQTQPKGINEKVLALVKNGQIILVGEWRGAKADEVRYTDKKTGQAKTFQKATHVIEVGEGTEVESIHVDEMLPDGTDAKTWAHGELKKGDLAIVILKSLQVEFGKREVSAIQVAKA